MSANTDLIEAFCEAWARLDPIEIASYFTQDGVYHNMPAAPIEGRDEIEGFIRGFAGTWTKASFDILNLAETEGVVIAERIDCIQAGDKAVDLPCAGVFTLRDGKIAIWRDYFDLGVYMRAMQ
jgi:limonene-1,2-epoxide hydrolase